MTAVSDLLIRAGHAVDRVQSDYGEDLLVQTAHAGQMDATRIWFQVKGTDKITRHRTASGGLRARFPIHHVLRWVRSADAVLIALWDVSANEGWFADPYQIDELSYEQRKSVTLRFHPDDRLDADTVAPLV